APGGGPAGGGRPPAAAAAAGVGAWGSAPPRGGESAALPKPGPSRSTNGCPAVPATYLMSENPGGGSTRPIGATPAFAACANTVCSSGSYDAPGQFVPPPVVPIVSAASGPSTLLTTPGRNTGPRR